MSDFLLWLFLFILGTFCVFLMFLGAMSLGKISFDPPRGGALARGASSKVSAEGGVE